MNVDKRYCQNRQRKRKRTIEPSPAELKNVSPAAEERQFKLRRFVEDVGKFLSEKENGQDQKMVAKTKTAMKAQRTVKKVTIPKPTMERGLFQNRMQTRFYTRVSGATNKEMTAKLDENMHQIISLVNNNQCNCRCTHHSKGELEHKTGLAPLLPRSTPSSEGMPLLPSPHSHKEEERLVTTSGGASGGTSGGGKPLSELDQELYPLFARVVSVSSTKTKSALFKNQSYVSAVKRKLLEIANGVNENTREVRCSSKPQKAMTSVGTSPFLSAAKAQPTLPKSEPRFKLEPANVRFQSTLQFLEETIGPSSTSSNQQTIPSPQCHQPHVQCRQSHVQCRQPHTRSRQLPQSLLSPPVVRYQRPQWVPKATRYAHEPFPDSSPPITPLYKYKSRPLNGSGDGFLFNCFNSFLPPIEEEEASPDVRYYPRKIF